MTDDERVQICVEALQRIVADAPAVHQNRKGTTTLALIAERALERVLT